MKGEGGEREGSDLDGGLASGCRSGGTGSRSLAFLLSASSCFLSSCSSCPLKKESSVLEERLVNNGDRHSNLLTVLLEHCRGSVVHF
jgi:hypothetical protein